MWSQALGDPGQSFATFAATSCPETKHEPDLEPPSAVGAYMSARSASASYLSFTFASSSEGSGGSTLVDTAAQHGLIGEDTLHRHDQYLQRHIVFEFKLPGKQVVRFVVFVGPSR